MPVLWSGVVAVASTQPFATRQARRVVGFQPDSPPRRLRSDVNCGRQLVCRTPLVRLGISSGKNWHHWFEELSSGFEVPSPIRDVCSCKADARGPVRFRRSTQLRDGL
jgi:hypothetical protein